MKQEIEPGKFVNISRNQESIWNRIKHFVLPSRENTKRFVISFYGECNIEYCRYSKETVQEWVDRYNNGERITKRGSLIFDSLNYFSKRNGIEIQ